MSLLSHLSSSTSFFLFTTDSYDLPLNHAITMPKRDRMGSATPSKKETKLSKFLSVTTKIIKNSFKTFVVCYLECKNVIGMSAP